MVLPRVFPGEFLDVLIIELQPVFSVTIPPHPLARGQHFATRHCVVLPAKASEVRIRLLALSLTIMMGRLAQSVLRLARGWTVRGSNPGGGEIFRTCPDRPWGPTQPPVQ
jgi:hypothetical protein